MSLGFVPCLESLVLLPVCESQRKMVDPEVSLFGFFRALRMNQAVTAIITMASGIATPIAIPVVL